MKGIFLIRLVQLADITFVWLCGTARAPYLLLITSAGKL